MAVTPYSQRQEWADITPLPQYENVNPLAPIFYSDEYKDATDYFRGVVRNGEMSERILELTEHIIRLNPAHYSAWQYRYKTIMALESPLDVELNLMDEIAVTHLKTYQVWHHRRLLLTAIHARSSTDAFATSYASEVGLRELGFIARCLEVDHKNYHTWAYRQWLLAHFDHPELWAVELPWVEQMLGADVRNNSAWHHRFFVVFQTGVRTGEEDRDAILVRELRFTKQAIALAPNNPSAWNYLRGVLDHTHTSYANLADFVQPYSAPRAATDEDVVDLDNPRPSSTAQLPCPAAIEFMADVNERAGNEDALRVAITLWKALAEDHDTIRRRYWEWRIKDARAIGVA